MQREVEIILMRQLASYLAMPIFIADPAGNLLFYNEPAEALLGCRFEETGELPAAHWANLFKPTDQAGAPITADDLPLVEALRTRHPVHRDFWIVGLDGQRRHLKVTAFPLVGQAGRFLGAVSLFWEGNPR